MSVNSKIVESILSLTPGIINSFPFVNSTREPHVEAGAGTEHYRLLNYISSNFYSSEALYDIGTYRGYSAYALAHSKTNFVISYDIEYLLFTPVTDNMEFRLGNFYKDPHFPKTPFIMFDIDPHDGDMETEFVKYIRETEFDGIILFDDIKLNEGMRKFWEGIDLPKHDISHLGHWSGTGLVDFG